MKNQGIVTKFLSDTLHFTPHACDRFRPLFANLERSVHAFFRTFDATQSALS